ncbi:DndE family protein [Halanaerobium congolense]|jgi:DNA sulfur modification protein DndE|uniref:DNA sulfur modification protein DndE n=1 Tax=Halanaerobium congolense TaxID=54121 RepID=A0A4R7DZ69_9FIRM|nr:DndE family protein [Halanaerobium congolense]TDS26201.1 DNA sulfur modification protein DndE [Halanaerobium congolense]SDK99889.1 DNA sulfur modification protein DndE [Halanaerobium congolense]SDN05507.1 DNA sulfur modification protein DndE [Halanaerobium congolense]
MASRLKTTEKTMEILKDLEQKSNLRPNILARIAINLAIQNSISPDNNDINYDNKGLEFHRQTLFGDYEQLIKSMISQKLNKHLTEEEFFPEITKFYLEEGVKLLESEYNYANNFERFFKNLINK